MRKNTTFLLILVFFLFSGVFVFLRSPYFEVEDFVVRGNVKVSKEEILALAEQGEINIFAYDLDKPAALIQGLPWILEARVSRQLPRTITIRVEERTPVAFLPAGENAWLLDPGGRVLGEDDGEAASLLALTGVQEDLVPGIFLDPQKYGAAIRVASAICDYPEIKATEVSVHGGSLTLILDNGCTVLLGDKERDIERKLLVLKSILVDLFSAGQVPRQIDLRYEKPAVRL